MAVTDKNIWNLLDDTFVKQAILPTLSSHLYLVLNEPGSGSLDIPLESVSAGIAGSGMFSELLYRGSSRGGFFVDNIQKRIIEAGNVDGGQNVTLSGRGALALLEDAIIWDDGSGATTRTFTLVSKASMLITLITEAKARGALSNLSYDFTALIDSTSVAWSDSSSIVFNVGTSLLDIIRRIVKSGIDFDITSDGDGNFTLHAYKNGKGINKSDTVFFRVGKNCRELSTKQIGNEIRNVFRLKYPGGYSIVSDATSIATNRRREDFLDLNYAGNSEVASSFGAAELENKKDPRYSISIKIYDGVSPNVFTDYELGDTITYVDHKGTAASYRIRGIQLDMIGQDYANIILDLNDIILENEISMNQNVEYLREIYMTAHDDGLLVTNFWATIGRDENGVVRCMQVVGNKIYVGGEFTHIGGIEANRIAVYDIPTGVWSSLGTGLNNTCLAIVVSGSNVYAGGSFTTAGGIYVGYIAKWNGSSWSALDGGLNGPCWAIAINGTSLYAGGAFTEATGLSSNRIAKWNTSTLNWSALGTGLNNVCAAIVCDAFNVYAGGYFTTAGGVAANRFAKFSSGSWSALGSGLNGEVLAILEDGGSYYVGGQFTQAGGSPANKIAVWNAIDEVWETLGEGIGDLPGGFVLSIATNGFDIYVAGLNMDVGGVTDQVVAKWNRVEWSAFGGELEAGLGYCVAIHSTNIYIGGSFLINDVQHYIAAYLTTFESVVNYLENANVFNLGEAIHAATEKNPPVDADEWAIWDSISKQLRKVTWANIKSTLRTYFDTVYALISHTHDAIDITSGIIATARLGSGTADATTFLRGDQIWTAPPEALIPVTTITHVEFERIFIDGALAVLSDVIQFIITRPTTLHSIPIYCRDNGSASSTIVDIHLNGVTIFTTQANRPTLAYNATSYAVSGTPDVVDLVAGDILAVQIDQIATGAEGLSIAFVERIQDFVWSGDELVME